MLIAGLSAVRCGKIVFLSAKNALPSGLVEQRVGGAGIIGLDRDIEHVC